MATQIYTKIVTTMDSTQLESLIQDALDWLVSNNFEFIAMDLAVSQTKYVAVINYKEAV